MVPLPLANLRKKYRYHSLIFFFVLSQIEAMLHPTCHLCRKSPRVFFFLKIVTWRLYGELKLNSATYLHL